MRISDWSSDVCSSDLEASRAKKVMVQAQIRLDHLLLGAGCLLLALLDGLDDAPELRHRQPGPVGEPLDLRPDRLGLGAALLGEPGPFRREAGHPLQPARLVLVAEIVLEELLAADLTVGDQAQKLALIAHQRAVEAVELIHQLLDPGVVEAHALQDRKSTRLNSSH